MLAEGAKNIRGFDQVELNAAKQISGSGKGSLTLASNNNTASLQLKGTLTGAGKSDQTINANNFATTILAGSKPADANTAIGAKLTINAKSILDQGSIDLAAGSLSLQASGDVTLGSTSHTSVAGAMKMISGQKAYASAGSIKVESVNGNLAVNSGAVVDVSSLDAGGGDAGKLSLTASKGAVSVDGQLKGAAVAGYKQGSFVLDANTLGGTLTALNDRLMTGGFNQSIDMRVRSGDLSLGLDAGSLVKAHSYHLAADAGNIDVYGTVDASGITGGDILLAANNNLTLHSGALLDAHATGYGNTGGKVSLATTVGTIDLNNQRINVDGGQANSDLSAGPVVSAGSAGSVLLRAPQITPFLDPVTGNPILNPATGNKQYTEVAVNNTGGTSLNVSTGANVTVEAFRTYTAPTTIQAADVAIADPVDASNTSNSKYFNDAANFANNNAYAIKTRLGMTAVQHLTPGVELDSTGDITLAADWDLSKWRFNNGNDAITRNNTEAGMLTLRAAGNLNFGAVDAATGVVTTASLSDGFDAIKVPIKNTIYYTNSFNLLSNNYGSWSYRLVAGADRTGANVLAVNNDGTGDVVLAPGSFIQGSPEIITVQVVRGRTRTVTTAAVPSRSDFEMIRTGTGSIDIAAGGGLYLGNSNSTIYTAGQINTPTKAPVLSNSGKFTTGGGDINIAVKGNISAVGKPDTNGYYSGSAVNQLISDWLLHQGSAGSANPSAWWINYDTFAQNIGALGGGNLNISAGGNITSLSAVVPGTGYVDTTNPASPVTRLMTGGNLNVSAGGNIDSGIFYVGNGQGTISAGGELGYSRHDTILSIDGTRTNLLYTILALGTGNFDVKTGGDLNLQTVFNPTTVGSGQKFFTYGANSGVTLESLNGNVLLSNNNYFIPAVTSLNAVTSSTSPILYSADSNNKGAYFVYPGTLNATALNGSIATGVSTSMFLFPSASGNLKFVAGADINLSGKLQMSDVNPSGLQASTPFYIYEDNLLQGHGFVTVGQTQQALHAGDMNPVVIAAAGSISGDNNVTEPDNPGLILPKAAVIQAGADITNLTMAVQNNQSSDVTSVTAGHDILYLPNAAQDTVGITVTGPGQLVLQAGRNVDLGKSFGLVSKGNLNNPYLPEQGADITVLAGVGEGATHTKAFIDKYIDPSVSSTYGKDLIDYVKKYKTDLPENETAAQAYSIFGTLSKPLQDAFARQIFFNELKQTGRSAVNTGNYKAGYDAIATLFPSSAGHKGDINLYSSQIKTQRGGDINLLTPGGSVNAGLASASNKKASELGVVTVKGGNVNAFVNNDFLVNQSRVFTLQGGNILMWASYGDIDAGKGSKTASSTPPPLLVVDPKTGNFIVDVTGSVVGSGIRVLLANKGVKPGDVDLIAPAGTVNAGDAGIGSAGNITIAALHVVGADNINFGGVSAGVPVAAPAPVSVGLGNLTDMNKGAEDAMRNLAKVNDVNSNDFKPTFLSVEVIGLGDQDMGSGKDKDKDKGTDL